MPPGEIAAALNRARRGRVAAMMRRSAEGGLAVHDPLAVQRLFRAALRLTPGAVQRRMVDGFYRLPAY